VYYLPSQHHLTDSFIFPSDQIFPRTQKTQKLTQCDSRRLAGIHHHQATQLEPRKLGFPTRVAWRLGVHRQAVSLQKPRNGKNDMRRLAAMNNSPGGF